MDILRKKTWSPYTAGALAGLLLVLSVFLTGKYFGASTTFVRAAGFVEQSVAPEKVAGMAYFLAALVAARRFTSAYSWSRVRAWFRGPGGLLPASPGPGCCGSRSGAAGVPPSAPAPRLLWRTAALPAPQKLW